MRKAYFQIAEYKSWLNRHKKQKLAFDNQHAKRNTESPKTNDSSSYKTNQNALELHPSGLLFETYRSTLEMRSKQALRSVLVTCMEQEVLYVLTALQKKFETEIVEAHSYPLSGRQRSLLVEFKSVPNPYSFILDKRSLPTVTHKDASLLQKVTTYQSESFQMDTVINCEDLSEQIMCLYKGVKMSETLKRQHYFVGELIRNIVQRVHPAAEVCLFGSSVSGIALEGKSDLDIVILLNGYRDDDVLKPLNNNMKKKINRLLFSDLLYIRHARVPILKFEQIHTRLACDVSCNNLGGIMTAEALCWLNEYEPMFQPLVTAIKVWSKNHYLTATGPGHYLSNHMLTMLVITFLQQCDHLPALQTAYVDKNLLSTLDYEDLVSTWNNLRLKNPHKLTMAKLLQSKREDIGSLLFQFFKFYSEFPFDNSLLDVAHGKIIKSRHMNDIYMPNPYERQHNMCRNVRSVSVERFKYLCQKSAEALHNYSARSDHEEWGLMSIMNRNKLIKYQKNSLVLDMDDIFNTDESKVEEIVVEIDESNQYMETPRGTYDNAQIEKTVLNLHGSNNTTKANKGKKAMVNQSTKTPEGQNLTVKNSKKKRKGQKAKVLNETGKLYTLADEYNQTNHTDSSPLKSDFKENKMSINETSNQSDIDKVSHSKDEEDNLNNDNSPHIEKKIQ